ncbi:MAG: hypothetical protein ACI8VY_001513, partial [Cellvibrionaceae bacterium]
HGKFNLARLVAPVISFVVIINGHGLTINSLERNV